VKKLETNKQIVDDADFKEIGQLAQSKITFDFNQVDMINSCGIREWIKFLENVPEKTRIVYRQCPQIIIEQINMVHGFFRKGSSIETLYAPYFCESCEHESKEIVTFDQIKNKKAPKIDCPKCGHEFMDFDAIESQYFGFVNKL
jgi:DNA-directed RNA polymerase subunit RPC12/RpoP